MGGADRLILFAREYLFLYMLGRMGILNISVCTTKEACAREKRSGCEDGTTKKNMSIYPSSLCVPETCVQFVVQLLKVILELKYGNPAPVISFVCSYSATVVVKVERTREMNKSEM